MHYIWMETPLISRSTMTCNLWCKLHLKNIQWLAGGIKHESSQLSHSYFDKQNWQLQKPSTSSCIDKMLNIKPLIHTNTPLRWHKCHSQSQQLSLPVVSIHERAFIRRSKLLLLCCLPRWQAAQVRRSCLSHAPYVAPAVHKEQKYILLECAHTEIHVCEEEFKVSRRLGRVKIEIDPVIDTENREWETWEQITESSCEEMWRKQESRQKGDIAWRKEL